MILFYIFLFVLVISVLVSWISTESEKRYEPLSFRGRRLNLVKWTFYLSFAILLVSSTFGNIFKDILLYYFSDTTNGNLLSVKESPPNSEDAFFTYRFNYEYYVNKRSYKGSYYHESYTGVDTSESFKKFDVEYVYFLPFINQPRESGLTQDNFIFRFLLPFLMYIIIFYLFFRATINDFIYFITNVKYK